jgi:hypothetical protein
MAATRDAMVQNFGGIGGHKNLKLVYLDLGEYATNGVALTSTILGTGPVLDVLVFPAGGYVPSYDRATGKVLVYWVDTTTDGAPLAEVTAATNLAAVSFPALVISAP